MPERCRFFSTKFTATQRNCPTVDRDAYDVMATEQVFGNKIIVYYDHNPLTFLTASTFKTNKLMGAVSSW